MPVVKTVSATYVGIELRDLPAVQSFEGGSRILTIPSWRLPLSLRSIGELPAFVTAALQRDFGITVRNTWELGGSYFSSPGVTPEVVYPFVVEVEASGVASSPLHFIDLLDLNPGQLHDAHLLISTHRLAEVMQLADQVLVINGGKVAGASPMSEFPDFNAFEKYFLERVR